MTAPSNDATALAPHSNGHDDFVITIQPFKGNAPIGTPAKVNVDLRRVGSAS